MPKFRGHEANLMAIFGLGTYSVIISDISDIYSNEITEETIQIIDSIIKIRKKLIERDSTSEDTF